MQATPPLTMPGVAAHASSFAMSPASLHGHVVRTTARFAPPGGVNSTVTARSSTSVPKPGDEASQIVGRTCISTKSPGRANGRSSVPTLPRKIGCACGIRLQPARARSAVARTTIASATAKSRE